ncbi:MAG: DNA-directed RNA polymerase subunit omega [Pseudomonadota bacterium]
MARITVEDCLQKVNNRFTLIHMAAKRVRQLRKGAEPKISSKNKDIVVSLREIAAGYVVIDENPEKNLLIQRDAAKLPQIEPGAPGDEGAPDETKSGVQASDGKG